MYYKLFDDVFLDNENKICIFEIGAFYVVLDEHAIYLFGKVKFKSKSKSKLKYVIYPNLSVYMEIVIETTSLDKFFCIVNESILDKFRDICLGDYICIVSFARFVNDKLYVYIQEVYR